MKPEIKKNTEQLWNALQEEWNKITRQDINKLFLHAAEDVREWLKLQGIKVNIKQFLNSL